jgi:hypothetical protein
MTHLETDREEVDKVIRQMGTNTLPYLIRELGAKHSPIKWRLARLASKHAVHTHYIYPDERRERAVAAFQALGSVAAPAIFEIKGYVADPELREYAERALRAIGDGDAVR